MALSRPLSVVLVLLSSIILLSLRPIGNNTLHRREAASGSRPFQDVDLALNITSEGTRAVALLFGQPDQALNFTTEHRHVKRAINYQEAVCKGGELWNMIQEAFEGRRPPGPNFGSSELSNGWTESSMSGGLGGLPPGWDPAFTTFSGGGGRAPAESQIQNLLTSQDKPFRNAQGTQVQVSQQIAPSFSHRVTKLRADPNRSKVPSILRSEPQRHSRKVRRKPKTPTGQTKCPSSEYPKPCPAPQPSIRHVMVHVQQVRS